MKPWHRPQGGRTQAGLAGTRSTACLLPCVAACMAALALAAAGRGAAAELRYPIVGTGQTKCYDDRKAIPCPQPGQPFYGQDAQHPARPPAYRDNRDGTITDLNTGLMWVQARGAKLTWDNAAAGAAACRVGGHSDWRMPGIKELYSLINFTGGYHFSAEQSTPYLDTEYFGFVYGDESKGERGIDCQDWSATQYLGTTMNGNATVFGVNFADGRIKGYPKVTRGPRGPGVFKLYARYVRGNPDYGQNDFHDNGDGTLTDRATGLMWSKADSRVGMNWAAALAWVQAQNTGKHLGYSDWRLPNAKELQSIVDYTRAPPVTHSPALASLFECTALSDGEYPFFWSSTTHLDGPPDRQGAAAVYVAFGRALGWMQFPPESGNYRLLDVHGAGAQRSDPKTGQASDYPHGRGPQGDVIRIDNYVRLVRNTDPSAVRLVQPDLTPLPASRLPPRRPNGPPMGLGGSLGGSPSHPISRTTTTEVLHSRDARRLDARGWAIIRE